MKKNATLLAMLFLIVACDKNHETNSSATATESDQAYHTNTGVTGSDQTAANRTGQGAPNNPATTPGDGKVTEAEKNATPEMTDGQLLSRVHHINQMEIEMGKLAVKKSKEKYVQEYGKDLQKEHAAADVKVKAVAQKVNAKLTEPEALSEAEAIQMKEHKELMSKLEKLSGKEFDKQFLEGMKTGHEEAIHMLETVQVSNADVKNLIGDVLPTIRNHYRKSIDVMQDLAL